jgi:hypothetical protein
MLHKRLLFQIVALGALLTCVSVVVYAAEKSNNGNGNNGCKSLPGYGQLKAALIGATATETSGLNNQMWGTIVDKDGIVCAVAFTGVDSLRPVARQPSYLGPESQHRNRL